MSIIPGIEILAPDLTDTSNGFSRSPNFFLVFFSIFFSSDSINEVMKISNAEVGDSIFLACGKVKEVEKILSNARDKLADELKLISNDIFAFCWIVDYPMFEVDEKTKEIILMLKFFSSVKFFIEKSIIKNEKSVPKIKE